MSHSVPTPILIPADGPDPMFPDPPPPLAGPAVGAFSARFLATPHCGRLPNCDVAGTRVSVSSLRDVRRALVAAAGSPGVAAWAAAPSPVLHPTWWPRDRAVPSYDQVIFSVRSASIGIHIDQAAPPAPPSADRRPLEPVATYLTLVSGTKRVLLLPPSATWLTEACAAEDRPEFPHGDAERDGAVLRRVVASGGYCFELRVQGDGDATTLYMPKGWWHWVVATSEAAVAYGGSRW